MNVRDMIHVLSNQEGITITEPMEDDRSPDWNWFRIQLENGWMISCGYGRSHYCGSRLERFLDPKDSETVEIAIFDSLDEWHLVEGMIVNQETRTGVLTFQDADQLFRIVEYISMKEDLR